MNGRPPARAAYRVLVPLLLAALAWCPAREAGAGGDVPELWFPVGEKLAYQVHWGILPVGTAEIASSWVEEGGRTYLAARFRAWSNRLIDRIYRVEDTVETLVDPVTFLPLRVEKRLSEGRLRFDDVLTFDHERGRARWENRVTGKSVEYAVPANAQDIVSFLYSLRREPLRPAQEIATAIAVDNRMWDFIIRVGRREDIRLPAFGAVPCVRVRVQTADRGFFVNKIPGTIWVSTDERRFVTRMYIRAPIGSLRADLARRDLDHGMAAGTPAGTCQAPSSFFPWSAAATRATLAP